MNLLAPHDSIRFRLWGQRFDSEAIIDASRCISMQQFFLCTFPCVIFTNIYVYIWVCYSEFANHFLLLWWSLKTSTDEFTYLIFQKRKLLSQIWLSMNNAIINAACIITQYGSMQKIGFSFILFLIFIFYVIKGKAALELEGVLVSGCEFVRMLCVGWIAIVSRQIRLANTHGRWIQ